VSAPIYIAFGANLGDPRESFRQAIVQLEQSGITLIAMSGLWESPSWPPGMEAPNYINACKIDSAISKLPLCDVAAMEYLGRWDYDGFKKKRGKIT